VDLLSGLTRIVRGPRALPCWAIATLMANVVIVVTGGLVRLTGSGLGCPTWPKCTAQSYVSHPALGIHGAIEFGNRLLTLALVAVAVLTWLSALFHRSAAGRPRRDLLLATGLALGIPAQAVVGGISVLTRLNPYVVALHFGVSMVLVALAVWLVRATWRLPSIPVSRSARLVTWVAFGLMWLTVWLGTLVTGSGPHAGDEHAVRTGLDGMLLTQLHAVLVGATVVATVIALAVLRSRAAAVLLGVEAVQAAIGIGQYYLGVPIGLVALHLLGAALAVAGATNLLLSVGTFTAGVAGVVPRTDSAGGDPDRQPLDAVDEVAAHSADLAGQLDRAQPRQ
jgi:cytochrome c oxidase assembly protein subunit 15